MSSSLPQVGLTSGPGAEWEQDHEEGLLPLQGDQLLQITVRRGSSGTASRMGVEQSGLGVMVDAQNVIEELTPGAQAQQDGRLVVGDVVVAVDGIPMFDAETGMTRLLKDVMSTMPAKDEHTFSSPAGITKPSALSQDTARSASLVIT